jgi:uncharacterized protein YkwD
VPDLASAPTATATITLPPAAPLDPTETPVEIVDEPVVAEEPAPTEAPVEPTTAPAAPAVVPPTATPVPPRPAPTATPVPPPPAPPAAPVATGLNGMEAAMFNQHNQQRAGGGLGALTVDPALTAIARQRAQDMAAKNYFAHTSPTGETAFTLMNASGYRYAIAGENIARNNYPDAESVGIAMKMFMESPSHRSNIMDGRYTKVGIGLVIDSAGMKYFAVVFAG